MNHRTHGLALTLNAINDESMSLGREMQATFDAMDEHASLVTMKCQLDEIAKHASRIAALAHAEASSLSDFLNRNARVA